MAKASKHSLGPHGPVNVYVRDLKTREIVHTIEVKEPCARKLELVVAGLLRKTDTERFFIDDSEGDRYYR